MKSLLKLSYLLLAFVSVSTLSSCKDDDDKDDAPAKGSIKLNMSISKPADDDFHLYYLTGNITVNLVDSGSNVLLSKVVPGTAGSVTFDNLAPGYVSFEASTPYTRVRKSNGSSSNLTLYEDFTITNYDGKAQEHTMVIY